MTLKIWCKRRGSRAWEKRATFTSPGSYRAWLYRIATNLCLNTLTRVPRRSLPPDTHHLREVLEWPAVEVAEWLNLSVPAVKSALQRARRTLHQRDVGSEARVALPGPQLQTLLDRYVALWEQDDISGLVALLREDAWFTMPPIPAWVQGRAAIAMLLSASIFTPPRQWRLLPTHANGSPAFGLYLWEAETRVYQLAGLLVLDVVGEQIGSTDAFLDLSCLSSFALPSRLAP